MDIDVRGLQEIQDLGRVLKSMGDSGKGLRRELYAGLNRETKDVRGELKEVIPAVLPRRGGLAATIQRASRFTTSPKFSGRFLGVTIWGKARGHDMRTLTGRRLRHPVYGNRSRWVNQTAGVEPQILMGKWEDQRPEVREAILGVITDIRSKIYRKV